jgi:hypothetical protein
LSGYVFGAASKPASREVMKARDKTDRNKVDDPLSHALPPPANESYGENVDWIQCGAK